MMLLGADAIIPEPVVGEAGVQVEGKSSRSVTVSVATPLRTTDLSLVGPILTKTVLSLN